MSGTPLLHAAAEKTAFLQSIDKSNGTKMLNYIMKHSFLAVVALGSLALAPTSRAADSATGSDDMVAKLTAAFDKLDKNADGAVSKEEFMNRKRFKDNPEAAEKASKVFTKLDTNADGALSKDEFVNRGSKGGKTAGGAEGGE